MQGHPRLPWADRTTYILVSDARQHYGMSTSANEHKHNNNGDDGEEESKPEVEQTGSCACACCRTCCSAIEAKLKPCMSEHNPLPENPTCCDRFRYAFLCPPHGKLAKWITRLLLLVVTWALLWVLIGNEALPPGWVFALLILYAACTVAGYLTTFLKLPPLLGMSGLNFAVLISRF